MAQVDAAERMGARRDVARRTAFRSGALGPGGADEIATAIAARTGRIKIGIAVQVLPLCHPLRLAEEAATVDQISRGRLIFGVGRSGVVRTYEAYGVPYEESHDRFAETLDIIRQAWSGGRVFPSRQIPQLRRRGGGADALSEPLPPIRMAAQTPRPSR